MRLRHAFLLLVTAAGAFAALTALRAGWPVLDADAWLEARRATLPGWAHALGQTLDWLGGHWWLPPAVAGAVLLTWRHGRPAEAVLLVVASAGADAFLHLVKVFVDADRAGEGTTLPESSSYPSGHATTALAVYVTLALVMSRAAGKTGRGGTSLCAAAALLGVAVGCGRWLDGRRAASDVVGGLVVGVVWLAGVELTRRWAVRGVG